MAKQQKSFDTTEIAQPKKVTFRAKLVRGYQEIEGVRFGHHKVPGYGNLETPFWVSEKLYDAIMKKYKHFFYDGHISAGREAPEEHSQRFAIKAREDHVVKHVPKKNSPKPIRRGRRRADASDHQPAKSKPVPEPVKNADGTTTIFDAAQLDDGVEI